MARHKSYQYRLDSPELGIVQHVRELVNQGDVEQSSPSHVERLSQEIEIRVHVDRQYLCQYKVSAQNTITEFANVGAKVQAKLLGWPDSGDEDNASIDDEVGCDSLLWTQRVLGGTQSSTSDKSSLWDLTKAKLIPDFVNQVILTVDKTHTTPSDYKELKDRFSELLKRLSSPPEETVNKSSHIAPMSKLDDTELETLQSRGTVPTQLGYEKTEDDVSMVNDNSTLAFSDETTPYLRIPRNPSPQIDVRTIADEISLNVKNPDAVQGMYNFWMAKSQVRGKGNQNANSYYANLVDLCIVAKHALIRNLERYDLLEEEIVKKWQETDYRHRRALPDVDYAIKVFQWLPKSSLCEWITITYSFLWSTTETGDYEQFRQDLDTSLNNNAIANFLYAIAFTRCGYTKGEDLNVLPMWCNVHSHPRGGTQEAECLKFRDNISSSCLDKERRKKEADDLEKAKDLIVQHNGKVTMMPSTTVRKLGKRRAEGLLDDGPLGKRNRSSGRGLDR